MNRGIVSTRSLVALWAVIAALLLAGAAAAFAPVQAYAADQTQYGADGVVLYQHDGLDNGEKRVSYGTVGNYAAADDIYQDGHQFSGYQVVYCINPTRNATSNEAWNANFRWRWNLTANQWLLDNNKRNLENPDLAPGSAGYERLMKVLYVGYGQNGTGKDFGYAETQNAVFHVVCGTGSANDVVNEADAVDLSSVQYTGYMYLPDSDAAQVIQNTVGMKVWNSTPPTPTPSGPTGTVSFSATKTLEGLEFSTDQTQIQFAFRMYLPDGTDDNGQYHTRCIPRDTTEDAPGSIFFGDLTFGEGDLGTKTIKFRELQPSDGIKSWIGSKEVPCPAETEGVIYDTTEYEVEIEIVKEGDEIKIYQDGNDVTEKTIEVGTFVNKMQSKEPGIKNTTAKVNGSTGSVKLATGQQGTMTDTVELENLDEAKTYEILCYIFKDGKQFADSGKIEVAGTETSKEVSFNKKITESGEYSIKTELYEKGDDTAIATHNAELNIESETVTVTFSDSPSKGEIKTTIKVGGTTAAPGNLLSIEQPSNTGATTMWVEDIIAYKGLEPNAVYTVTGKLMAFQGDDATGTECATVTKEFTADAEGEGAWTMSFGNQTLQEATYYVVYETAVNKNNPENSPGPHEDATDLAQAVVVQPADEITIVPREVPMTPASGLEMSTVVDIDGKAASTNTARQVAAADASKVKKVNDTISYKGFAPGEYTINGQLMDVTNAKTAQDAKEIAKASTTLTAANTGSGTWEMTFEEGVKLEQGHKYVVFETALDSEGNEVAKHADINDKAQTIIVAAKATANADAAKAGTTAKTADGMGSITLGALFVALAAAGVAMVARRKSEQR